MLQKIIDIVAREMYVDPSVLTSATRLDADLDMDRVDRLAMQIQLEDGLHMSIDTDKMCAFETISDIEQYAIAHKRVRGIA